MRDPRLTRYARDNRKQMSEPAIRVWLQVRAKRFMGVKFRREKVIGRYIGDFAANAPRLVIEVDGDTHDADNIYDKIRNSLSQPEGLSGRSLYESRSDAEFGRSADAFGWRDRGRAAAAPSPNPLP